MNKENRGMGILQAALIWLGVYIVIPLLTSIAACLATCLVLLSMRSLMQ